MEIISVYKCLCDLTRLRILNLLNQGPLCVCHIQEILKEPQAKTSKQLSYMKNHGLLESFRHYNWTIYQLPASPNVLLEQNLKCLQDVAFKETVFKQDMKRLGEIDTSQVCEAIAQRCC